MPKDQTVPIELERLGSGGEHAPPPPPPSFLLQMGTTLSCQTYNLTILQWPTPQPGNQNYYFYVSDFCTVCFLQWCSAFSWNGHGAVPRMKLRLSFGFSMANGCSVAIPMENSMLLTTLVSEGGKYRGINCTNGDCNSLFGRLIKA